MAGQHLTFGDIARRDALRQVRSVLSLGVGQGSNPLSGRPCRRPSETTSSVASRSLA
jgi:hypothetical protein